MKIICIILLFPLFSFGATNYYFSSSTGSDGNACTIGSPCATIPKATVLLTNPGDSILFKRGDLFPVLASLVITRSGSAGNSIVYGAYGSGADPIITAFVNLSTWASRGSNLYQAFCGTCSATVNLVQFNAYDQPMGRFPDTTATNGGYLTYTSGTTSSIVADVTDPTTTWAGATAIVRTNNFILDPGIISSESGGVINFSNTLSGTPTANYGYFIQNDIRTLSTVGEWFWKTSVDSLIMDFVGTTPGGNSVSIASADTVISIGANYITIDGIDLKGGNKYLICFTANSNHDTLRNGVLSYAGINAIQNTFVVKDCSFSNTNFQNIHNNVISAISPGEIDTTQINSDSLINISIIPGAGLGGGATYCGITIYGYRDSIQKNYFYNLGGPASTIFGGDNNVWQYNFVNIFEKILCDGGGIYGSVHDGNPNYILNNIIINGVGQHFGTTLSANTFASPIYLDNGAKAWVVTGNTGANSSYGGIYTHFSRNCTIKSNTFYGNTYQWYWQEDNLPDSMRGNVMKYNKYISNSGNLNVAWYNAGLNDLTLLGTLDSNYYSRATDDNSSFKYTGGGGTFYNISGWQSLTNQDFKSKTSPIQLTIDANTLFLYNATMSPRVSTLTNSYIDVTGACYGAGTITLQPFTSLVLFNYPTIPVLIGTKLNIH